MTDHDLVRGGGDPLGRRRRGRRCALVVVACLAAASVLVAVASRDPASRHDPRSESESGVGAEASCVAMIVVDEGRYFGVGSPDRVPPLTGISLPAVMPGCNDNGADVPQESDSAVEVSEIEGVAADVAVWTQGGLYVRDGAELPAFTRAWFRRPTCSPDGPTVLVVDWYGVTSQRKVRFDGDIRPPLRIEAGIVAASPPSPDDLGYTITIADDGSADPALDKQALEEALWSSRARLRVRVHCDGKRFVAESFELDPVSGR